MLTHWDDAPRERREAGDMRADMVFLGGQDLPAGARLARIDPGARHMPLHRHWGEEELFHVVAGSGVVVLGDAAHEVGEGDTVVRRAGGEPHAFVAGRDGMDLLLLGENLDLAVVELPRAGLVRRGGLSWRGGGGVDPLQAEVAAGPLQVPEVAPRPSSVVHWRDVFAMVEARPGYAGEDRDLARAGGSLRTGLRRCVLEPGQMSCPPHWHAQETEIFVVLDGTGTFELYDLRGRRTSAEPVRPGSVAIRPPGSGEGHALVAGEGPLTYLAYGTRVPGEAVHYPRSSKVLLGKVMLRVDAADDYWEGEP